MEDLERRRHDFSEDSAALIRACWLEESVESDDDPWPGNRRPDFAVFRGALSRVLGPDPAPGWPDPVAEVQARSWMDAGLGTLRTALRCRGWNGKRFLNNASLCLRSPDELDIPRPARAGQFIVEGEQKGLKPAPGADGAEALCMEDSPAQSPRKAVPKQRELYDSRIHVALAIAALLLVLSRCAALPGMPAPDISCA